MPANPNEPIPLYGGMKIQPPRSETRNVYVFAVIANPIVLQQKGKFAEDLKVCLYKKLLHLYFLHLTHYSMKFLVYF